MSLLQGHYLYRAQNTTQKYFVPCTFEKQMWIVMTSTPPAWVRRDLISRFKALARQDVQRVRLNMENLCICLEIYKWVSNSGEHILLAFYAGLQGSQAIICKPKVSCFAPTRCLPSADLVPSAITKITCLFRQRWQSPSHSCTQNRVSTAHALLRSMSYPHIPRA